MIAAGKRSRRSHLKFMHVLVGLPLLERALEEVFGGDAFRVSPM